MTDDLSFEEINDVKANMDHIYDQADPRAYFRELKSVAYDIPGSAKPIFQTLICRLRAMSNRRVRILDLGCAYGINAALLKHNLSIEDLYERWGA